MLNHNPLLPSTSISDQPKHSTTSVTTSAVTNINGSETKDLESNQFTEINWNQVQNNLHLMHGSNLDASSQYLQMLQSTPNFITTFPNNSQLPVENISRDAKKGASMEAFLEQDLNSFQLPQANFSYNNFNPLELSQFQIPSQFELDNSHNYLQDCLTPNFFMASARPPPPTPDSPFLLTNPYLELSGLTPSHFNLLLTPNSRSSPYGMHLIPSETLLPPSAFPEPDKANTGAPLQLSCTSLTDPPVGSINNPKSSTENILVHDSLSSSTNQTNSVQGLATASSLLCLDKETVGFTEPTINQTKSQKEIKSPKVVRSIPPVSNTSSVDKTAPVSVNSRSDFTSSPQPSPSLKPTLICAPSSMTASAIPAVVSPPLGGSRAKRFKKPCSVRKLLPLLPSAKSSVPENEKKPPVQSTTFNESPLLPPISSIVASPLGLLPHNSFTAQLASKSNYQLLREGRTTELGLNFGPEATESLFRKRKAHKDAERLRRQNQTDQLQALRQVLSYLPTTASKMTVLSEARETLVQYDTLIKHQTDLIRTLLTKICPDGDLPSDLPQDLSQYRSDTFDPTKK